MENNDKVRDMENIQRKGLKNSVAFVLRWILRELEHVHPEKIILSGVGQGGATALNTWFTTGMELVGFIGISCGMPFIGEWESVTNSCFKKRVNAEAIPLELPREV
jgi:predicted esterase